MNKKEAALLEFCRTNGIVVLDKEGEKYEFDIREKELEKFKAFFSLHEIKITSPLLAYNRLDTYSNTVERKLVVTIKWEELAPQET